MNQRIINPADLSSRNTWIFVIPVIGAIAMALPIEIRQLLYLHLDLSRQGEFWRLISGHFVYVSWLHWLLNSLGILLFWLFFPESRQPKIWLPAVAVTLVVVSAGLMVLSVNLVWYAGFSGILIGLFAYAAVVNFYKAPRFSAVLLFMITIYVFLQIRNGELVEGGLESVRTSSYAHAIGLIAGVVYGLLITLFVSVVEKTK